MSDPIYLDYNATTPVAPEVAEAMLPFLGAQFGNPSSSHVWGEFAKTAVNDARQQVAALIGACLLYTSPSPRDGLLSRMPSSA